jgi:DUF4097 and DUF4098 domain-containing protein YvlB
MRSLKFKFSAAVLCVLAASTMCAARAPDGTFQKTLQVNGPAELQVLTHSGDVTVRNGPAGRVSITGKIFVGSWHLFGSSLDGKQAVVEELQKNPPIQQSGNIIHIDYISQRNVAIDYEITVPADTSLTTKTGSGDQTVEGLERGAQLESGSGDFRLRDIKGEVHLRTGSGDVEAERVAGAFEGEAGSGDIRLEELGGGNVRAQTGSGNVEVRGVNGSLEVQTGSGDVTAEGSIAGGWELHTGSGDVRLHLPADAAFDLEAATSSGDVIVDHPVTMTVQGNVQHERKSVSGKVHGGGPLLSVHTGSGDVHIE